MADIAAHGAHGEVVPLREVAARQGLSRIYLSQLTLPLRHAALLRSVWGNKGGFQLGRPAAEIRVLDIAEAVDGPICVIDCAVDPNYCNRYSRCEVAGIWHALNDGIIRILNSQTLEDLAACRGHSTADTVVQPLNKIASPLAWPVTSDPPGRDVHRGGPNEEEDLNCRRRT